MCTTCEGQIILRTADGIEVSQKVSDCDIREYRKPVFNRAAVGVESGPNTFPTESHISYRAYRFRGEMQGEIRVLEEVTQITETSSKRDTDILEELVFEGVVDNDTDH